MSQDPPKTLRTDPMMILTLPDKSQVKLDKKTLRFHSTDPLGIADPPADFSSEPLTF